MTLIRHFQGVVHGITPSWGNRLWLKNAWGAQAENQARVGAVYSFESGDFLGLPGEGMANSLTGSLLLRIHSVALDGIDRRGILARVRPGDVVFVGDASGTVTGEAIWNGQIAQIPLDVWVPPVNGEYRIRFERP